MEAVFLICVFLVAGAGYYITKKLSSKEDNEVEMEDYEDFWNDK